jgi:anti-sigma regulatory factor (Ser/Thr protein kinase)
VTPVQIHEQLPKDPGSAAAARRILERLSGQLDNGTLSNARLLVTELVANAVQHVEEPGALDLDVTLRDDTLRVALSDPGHGFAPQPRRPDAPSDSGWGLHFVDQLAERWAVEVDSRARVWFEMKIAGQRA